MDSDATMTFSVLLVTTPLFALFSINVFTDMTTATWNPASVLLMIKLLVDYRAQKDSIMNWNLSLSRKRCLASLRQKAEHQKCSDFAIQFSSDTLQPGHL